MGGEGGSRGAEGAVEVVVFNPKEMDVAVRQQRGQQPLLLALQQQPREALDLRHGHIAFVVPADEGLGGGGGQLGGGGAALDPPSNRSFGAIIAATPSNPVTWGDLGGCGDGAALWGGGAVGDPPPRPPRDLGRPQGSGAARWGGGPRRGGGQCGTPLRTDFLSLAAVTAAPSP